MSLGLYFRDIPFVFANISYQNESQFASVFLKILPCTATKVLNCFEQLFCIANILCFINHKFLAFITLVAEPDVEEGEGRSLKIPLFLMFTKVITCISDNKEQIIDLINILKHFFVFNSSVSVYRQHQIVQEQ